jgi:hypothetical protein
MSSEKENGKQEAATPQGGGDIPYNHRGGVLKDNHKLCELRVEKNRRRKAQSEFALIYLYYKMYE